MELNLDSVMTGMPTISAVRQLESQLLQFPQVDLSTEHIVHAGLSARTTLIPAGTVLTGALTKLDNVCVVYGDITVTTEEGPQRLTGFNVIKASAGAKRAGIAHADTWWTTLHRTDLTSIADIEDEMTDESASLQTRNSALAQFDATLPLSDQEALDRSNFILYLERQGKTHEEATREGDLLIAIRRAWGYGPKGSTG